MTDMPVFGILCCGKDIEELAQSVKCCLHITNIMKNGGYALGGYHTALVKKGDEALTALCCDKLYHLCRNCDAVFTVGADGFAHDDIIPDITLKICESEAVFFSQNLCGSANIGNYDSSNKSKKGKTVFPPSRSRAGVVSDSLVMNIRNDEDFITNTLNLLLPSITFAVEGLCGKNAEISKKINESLAAICTLAEKGKNDRIVFDGVQKIEIK